MIFKAQNATWNDAVEIAIIHKSNDGKVYYAKPIAIELMSNDDGTINRAMELPTAEATQLLQALWDCGLRPAGYEPGDEVLKATKYHLEDFRRLVFERKE